MKRIVLLSLVCLLSVNQSYCPSKELLEAAMKAPRGLAIITAALIGAAVAQDRRVQKQLKDADEKQRQEWLKRLNPKI